MYTSDLYNSDIAYHENLILQLFKIYFYQSPIQQILQLLLNADHNLINSKHLCLVIKWLIANFR